jgi:capsular polysaccharide biosynthesis protein
VQELDGAVAVLTTRGVDNYYHFLTDVLPRLELLRRAGVEPDRYLVNRDLPFQSELLDTLGIGAERVLTSAAHPHVRAERLLVPSLPDSHLRTPPWLIRWLRGRLLPRTVAPAHRRLYVSRGTRRNTRYVTNEQEVLAALVPLGFECVDPGTHSVAEQIRLFSEAELVVGAHGAGLTNLAFCTEGAGVVELFPPDYVNVCYWALCNAAGGLRYRYLVGDGLARRARPMLGVASDITVNPQLVARLVSELSEGRPGLSSRPS